jgi:hypothetical protein
MPPVGIRSTVDAAGVIEARHGLSMPIDPAR